MKGKYAAKAALHQSVQSRDAEIETYKNAVKRLTGERNKALEELKQAQRLHATTGRELRERLTAGAAPELEALRFEMGRVAGERDMYKRIAEMQKKHIANIIDKLDTALHAAGIPVKAAGPIIIGLQQDLLGEVDPAKRLRRLREYTQNYATR